MIKVFQECAELASALYSAASTLSDRAEADRTPTATIDVGIFFVFATFFFVLYNLISWLIIKPVITLILHKHNNNTSIRVKIDKLVSSFMEILNYGEKSMA